MVTPLKEGNRVGKITKIIGHKNDVGVDILSFVYEYNFSPSFPDEVIEELDDIPSYLTEEEINKELSSGRRDLRSEEIFTIDGSDTKDIDDAISLSKLDDGKYKLGVHIADVSYYVKEGTKLDDEAYFRGTSVYLVDRVLPMLPHKNLIPDINLTPYSIWLATVVVSGISYLSYLLKRYVFHESSAAGMGCRAALDAQAYLDSLK